MRELPTSQPEILWIALGSPDGQTLLINDKDPLPGARRIPASESVQVSFSQWWAVPGAPVSGDWSVVQRADGVLQWAYQSKPLYSWLAEKTPAEVATNVGLTETATAKFAENAVVAGSLLPPEGWRVARFKPGK